MRRRRAVADPDELRVVGTAAARWIREKQHDTDPNRRRRRRRRRRARSLASGSEGLLRPPTVTGGYERAAAAANALTHARGRRILLQIYARCMCVCVRARACRRRAMCNR